MYLTVFKVDTNYLLVTSDLCVNVLNLGSLAS